MDASGKKVALLVDNYFEQAELEGPLGALRDAGVQVTVLGASSSEVRGMRHAKLGDTFRTDKMLADAKPEEYDALVLPGGALNADSLRMIDRARDWVKYFLESGKPIAAICHAPWVLVSADMVEGRRLTSYFTIQDDIRNAGGSWINQPVVTDENLITSRKPDDIPLFNDAILTMLQTQPQQRAAGDELVRSNAPVPLVRGS